jgi:xanthine dehydrogenase iron-sulfur cluster and FAD-binding subunit A
VPVEPPVTSPRGLGEAYAALTAADPNAPLRPLAGGTDLLVALTGELGEPPAAILDLWAIDGLRGIVIDDGALSLGALTTYAEIRRSPLCLEHVPALVEAAATIGAAQIQQRGTLGGNIANASPAGDTLPVLLAGDATIVVGSGRGEREIPAADFWTGYRRTALATDELVVRVRLPIGPRDALPQGRHASGAVDQQGRAGGRLAGYRALDGRPRGARVRRGDADPGGGDGGGPGGRAADPGHRRSGGTSACHRAPADR